MNSLDYSRHAPEPKTGEIYLADLHYQDNNGKPRPGADQHKKRPVLFYDKKIINGELAYKVIMISSQTKQAYNQIHGYMLKDWAQAGLKKESCVTPTMDRFYTIPKNKLIRKQGKPFGQLSKRDMAGIDATVTREQIRYARKMARAQIAASHEQEGPEL